MLEMKYSHSHIASYAQTRNQACTIIMMMIPFTTAIKMITTVLIIIVPMVLVIVFITIIIMTS